MTVPTWISSQISSSNAVAAWRCCRGTMRQCSDPRWETGRRVNIDKPRSKFQWRCVIQSRAAVRGTSGGLNEADLLVRTCFTSGLSKTLFNKLALQITILDFHRLTAHPKISYQRTRTNDTWPFIWGSYILANHKNTVFENFVKCNSYKWEFLEELYLVLFRANESAGAPFFFWSLTSGKSRTKFLWVIFTSPNGQLQFPPLCTI